MTPLETIKKWIADFPQYDILNHFQVDYTDHVPANGGIFPSGLVEVSRTQDVTGNVLVNNQYNFGVFYVFEKAPGDDAGATINADWIMDFQEWVQEQSVLGNAPQFGDRTIAIKAQNGSMFEAENEGTATYMVQLSVIFEKEFEVKNNV